MSVTPEYTYTDLLPADVLVPAYDDAAGVTAAFNLNVLSVLNTRLGADFDPDDFEHRAVWDDENAWIEMRLRPRGWWTDDQNWFSLSLWVPQPLG